MTKQLDKVVSSMTDADWLQVHVISQVNLFETKFNTRIDSQEIEDVCKTVADMKLPEGLDTYIAMLFLLPSIYNDPVYTDIAKLKMQGLTLGLDMLTYMYSQFCITDGYDEQVAFIFKNCIQYTIPF